jgi:DNA primase
MEIIDQVRQVASIVEIASQYTTIRKRGRKFVGLCPFHTEKTPSFTVDDEKQLFHCFGCGVGGDVFSLVMEKENLSFPEALRLLAEKYRIPLPQQSKLSPQVLKLEEKLFQISETALGFFKKNLFNTAEGELAMEYLKKRKISEETIQQLKIGYALNSWNALITFFKSKSVSAALLEKAGLAIPGRKADEYYDRFRARIIFPIFSLTGKVVAFGGRTVSNAEPKYLNSPDTPLYSKGKLLYGLNFTKDAIRDRGEMVLVEGYTDFSALYQAGVANVAASLGTALTGHQVALAHRFASRMVINYDGDSAGKAAALRAIPLCFEKGLNVRILLLPESLDPDGFLKKYGKGPYLNLIKKSIPGIRFLMEAYSKESQFDTAEEKGRIARNIVREIERIPDSVVRSEYLKMASDYLSIPEDLLRTIAQSVPASEDVKEKEAAFLSAEKRLIQILIENASFIPSVFREMKPEHIQGLKSESIFTALRECYAQGNDRSLSLLAEKIEPGLAGPLSKILLEKAGEATLEEALDCARALRKNWLEKRQKEIQKEITRLEKAGERDKIPPLLSLIQDITKQNIAL